MGLATTASSAACKRRHWRVLIAHYKPGASEFAPILAQLGQSLKGAGGGREGHQVSDQFDQMINGVHGSKMTAASISEE